MIKRRTIRANAQPNSQSPMFESLEGRAMLSANPIKPAAVTHPLATTTSIVLSRHVTRLGQAMTVTVTVRSNEKAVVPTGTVELLSKGTVITTKDGLPLTLTLNAAGKGVYTFNAGNLAFFPGTYFLKAQYLGDGTAPASTSRTTPEYVIVPPFKKSPSKDGLEIATVQPGHGSATAATGDTVQVEYTGLLASTGGIFDYNNADGMPYLQYQVETPPRAVIPGFDEGVFGMKVGETRTLYVPAALAYGSTGTFGIPPNADLIFLVTLKAIV